MESLMRKLPQSLFQRRVRLSINLVATETYLLRSMPLMLLLHKSVKRLMPKSLKRSARLLMRSRKKLCRPRHA